MQKQRSTSYMVRLSLFIGIEVLFAIVPFLGFIPLGVTRATTLHLPVILGGILLGPLAGGILGGVFGIISIITNTFSPTITSFVFSPFYGVGEMQGNAWSLVIALVPRILLGVFAAYVFRFVCKFDKTKIGASITAALIGSLTNTLLVMSGIYFFFGQSYAAAKNIPFESLVGVLIGIISVNGVLEAAVAAVAAIFIAVPLIHLFKPKI